MSKLSNKTRETRFDFRFALQPRIAKRGSACGRSTVFGSLVYEALGCGQDDHRSLSRRFHRRWTDKQLRIALQDVWSHGYRIVSVIKERAPEPGSTPEFRIEDSDLYEGHGSDMEIKKESNRAK